MPSMRDDPLKNLAGIPQPIVLHTCSDLLNLIINRLQKRVYICNYNTSTHPLI
jgi:hypothetical protein